MQHIRYLRAVFADSLAQSKVFLCAAITGQVVPVPVCRATVAGAMVRGGGAVLLLAVLLAGYMPRTLSQSDNSLDGEAWESGGMSGWGWVHVCVFVCVFVCVSRLLCV